MELKHAISQKLSLKTTPQLITTQHLLLLNNLELQQEIELELEQNPALELDIQITCPNCENAIAFFPCPNCGFVDKKEYEITQDEIAYLKEITDIEKKEFERKLPLNVIIPQFQNLHDYLRLNIFPQLKENREKEIAEIIIDNITDDGYLVIETEEIAKRISCKKQEVEYVLSKIQSLEPAGIGARNLKESLLLQLEEIETEEEIKKCAREIINSHLDDLSRHNYTNISKNMNIDKNTVIKVVEFIISHLTPYPARGFIKQVNFEDTVYIKPDIIIHRENNEWRIEVVDALNENLRINQTYLELYKRMKNNTTEYSENDINHIKNYIERAKMFLRSIARRKEVITEIIRNIIENQEKFFETNDRKYLCPLTQTKIANIIGISESTVSRSIANKYIQLQNKEIVPLQLFFGQSESIKKQIKEIIEQEDRKKPLSDHKISQILKQKGVNIARRTIAKYREELNILSSSQRKEIR